MVRRARLDAPGTLHHVIVGGIEKGRIVNDVAERKNFVQRVGELAGATKTAVYAWALMTNLPRFFCAAAKWSFQDLCAGCPTGYGISYNRRHRRWGIYFKTVSPVKLASMRL